MLPARLDRYDPSMLDMICLAGEAGWGRLSPAITTREARRPAWCRRRRSRSSCANTRAHGGRCGSPSEEPQLGETARQVLSVLRSRGASFFGDLASACGLDADQLRHAIGALVACGLATSDGFAGLRALVWAARGRPAQHDRRQQLRRPVDGHRGGRRARSAREEAVELQAWSLLRRYGVVFRRLLTRETNAATWRELARVYRRLEARGEIRSGRFVTGMSGEQFALPHAVEQLRAGPAYPGGRRLVTISAADPLNLDRDCHRGRTDPDRRPQPDRLSRRRAARRHRTRLRAGACSNRPSHRRRRVARTQGAADAGPRPLGVCIGWIRTTRGLSGGA